MCKFCRCVQFDGEIIVSGAYDNNIIVWDASNGTQIHLLVLKAIIEANA